MTHDNGTDGQTECDAITSETLARHWSKSFTLPTEHCTTRLTTLNSLCTNVGAGADPGSLGMQPAGNVTFRQDVLPYQPHSIITVFASRKLYSLVKEANVCERKSRIISHEHTRNSATETQLSLTNRATHLCKCNDVADLTSIITVSHGSAYTVVRATLQVNGKWQFWGCQNSVTPEPID